MSSRPQQRAIGGVTPLGYFTINPGTPQQITSKLALVDSTYSVTCRQLGFSVDSSVSGELYVNYGNNSGADSNATSLIVQSGTSQTLPIGAVSTEGCIDANAWYLDGSAAIKVAVYALDASS